MSFMLTDFNARKLSQYFMLYKDTTGSISQETQTKYRLVCTHFDTFSFLIPNMLMLCKESDIYIFFLHFLNKLWCMSSAIEDCARGKREGESKG